MPLDYREGPEARRGGLDITISLGARQVAALGNDDVVELAEAMDTVLQALGSLRTGGGVDADDDVASFKVGRVDAQWQEWVIRDLAYLRDRLAGIEAAAVRRHADDGGTYGELAAAMGVPRSTAQRRRDAITDREPDEWERWATTPADPPYAYRPHTCPPGRPVLSNVNVAGPGEHRPVQAGEIHGDVHVHRQW